MRQPWPHFSHDVGSAGHVMPLMSSHVTLYRLSLLSANSASRLPASGSGTGNRTVEMPDPENIGVTVGISLLTCLQAELCVLPV